MNSFDDLKQKYSNNEFTSESEKLLFEGLDYIREQRYLYKYGTTEKSIENFINSVIYFNSPINFNDKRDCSLKLLTASDKYGLDILRKTLETQSHQKYTDQQIEKLYNNNDDIKYKIIPSAFEDTKRFIVSKVLVTCFASNYDNELMWAHYTNKHTGICIEYDGHELIRHLGQTPKFPIFLKVRYISNIKPIVLDGTDNKGKLASWLAYKKDDWAYEEEIRCLFMNRDDITANPLPIPKTIYKSVYLGSDISSKDKDKILKHVADEKPWVKVYEMTMGNDLTLAAKEVLV